MAEEIEIRYAIDVYVTASRLGVRQTPDSTARKDSCCSAPSHSTWHPQKADAEIIIDQMWEQHQIKLHQLMKGEI